MLLNEQQELILLRDYQNEKAKGDVGLIDFLKSVFRKDEILNLPFRKTKLAFFNHKQTLIPTRLFMENEKAAYLEKIIELLPGDVVCQDHIRPIDTQVVYALSLEEKTVLSDQMPDLQLFHGASCFLTGITKLAEYRSGKHLYVNIHEGFLHILLFENKDLLFSNIFSFHNAKDALYFLMLIFDQFSLDPETVPVYLSGQILKESEIYKLLYRYIKKIQFTGAPEYISFGAAFQQLILHQYYDLFSLPICE